MSSNEDQYHSAHTEAERLAYQARDLIDDKENPNGHALLHETHQLVQDLVGKKNPRSIENNVKSIIVLLKTIRHEGDQVMDYRHIDLLVNGYEQFRQSLRKFDNY